VIFRTALDLIRWISGDLIC